MNVTTQTFLASAAAATGGLALQAAEHWNRNLRSRQDARAMAFDPDASTIYSLARDGNRTRWIEPVERRGTPGNAGERTGTYVCAGCQLPVYKSATKFRKRHRVTEDYRADRKRSPHPN